MRSPLVRVLAVGALLVGVGALQTLAHQVSATLGLVDAMMIAVGLVALRASFAGAVWTGAVGGLIQDALAGGIVGLHAFAKTLAAAALAVVGDFLAIRGQLAEATIVAAATALIPRASPRSRNHTTLSEVSKRARAPSWFAPRGSSGARKSKERSTMICTTTSGFSATSSVTSKSYCQR